MKVIIYILVLISLLITLSACGNRSLGYDADQKASAERFALRMASSLRPYHNSVVESVYDAENGLFIVYLVADSDQSSSESSLVRVVMIAEEDGNVNLLDFYDILPVAE